METLIIGKPKIEKLDTLSGLMLMQSMLTI